MAGRNLFDCFQRPSLLRFGVAGARPRICALSPPTMGIRDHVRANRIVNRLWVELWVGNFGVRMRTPVGECLVKASDVRNSCRRKAAFNRAFEAPSNAD